MCVRPWRCPIDVVPLVISASDQQGPFFSWRFEKRNWLFSNKRKVKGEAGARRNEQAEETEAQVGTSLAVARGICVHISLYYILLNACEAVEAPPHGPNMNTHSKKKKKGVKELRVRAVTRTTLNRMRPLIPWDREEPQLLIYGSCAEPCVTKIISILINLHFTFSFAVRCLVNHVQCRPNRYVPV